MTFAMNLAGSYTLCPGMTPSIHGHRPVLGHGILGRLLRGQQGALVERTLGQVFTLCAHAHRRTARLALNAANPRQETPLPIEPPVFLWLETARDHLRSIAMDWPQRQTGREPEPEPLDWLRNCPISLRVVARETQEKQAWDALGQLRHWLEDHLLGEPLDRWLTHHHEPEALGLWCRVHAANLFPAKTLHTWYAMARELVPATRPLDLLDANPAQQFTAMNDMAQAMLGSDHFVQYPTWLGQCAETGPWTRLRYRHKSGTAIPTAWTRLSARWIELLEIAAIQPPGPVEHLPPLLASGAQYLGEGQAIAWCEMARGLLLHWVQLDELGRVQDYRVLAPTEWNFHPNGALAQALSALPAHDTQSAWALAAAFDACVACQVSAPVPSEETHA